MSGHASPTPEHATRPAAPRPKVAWDRLTALVIGISLGLLHSSPFLPTVLARGLDWPIRLYGEAASLSTYGKWWVLPPHRFLTDAFSGEFPTFYNYASDALLNALAALGDWPPMTIQAVLYGPLLSALFFWGNAASIGAVTRDRRVGLVGALLLSLTGGSGLTGLGPREGLGLVQILHVPFHTLSLGTGQSLGWVLLLPSLALLHLARQGFTRRRAVAFGLVTGLLVHVHTLTFVNVAVAQLAYLTLTTARERPRPPGLRAWAVAVALLGVGFAVRAALRPFSFTALAAFGLAALVLNFLVDRQRPLYLWGYGTAAVVALPYGLALGRNLSGLSAIAEGSNALAVGPADLALFFAPQLLGALLACRGGVPSPVLTFFSSFFVATAGLALNHLWNWGNHPYRFAIHLLFPLAGLAAWGLIHGPRWPARLLAAWLSVLGASNVAGFLTGPRLYVNASIASPEARLFLETVRSVTAATSPQTRLLNAPEVSYPQGVTQSAVLLNYSRRPGFVPDYRYLLSRERYYNRLGLFCFLFPEFPAYDPHLDRRACEEPLEPPPDLVVIREPRLRSSILPAYGISLAAASGYPFGEILAAAEPGYGWARVADAGRRRRLVRVGPPALPGLARLLSASEERGGLVLTFDVERGGPHVAVLGGRSLDRRVLRVLVDGRASPGEQRRGNWIVLRAALDPGRHELQLERAGRDRDGETDVLYFAAIVHTDDVGAYLAVPGPGSARLE